MCLALGSRALRLWPIRETVIEKEYLDLSHLIVSDVWIELSIDLIINPFKYFMMKVFLFLFINGRFNVYEMRKYGGTL